MSSGYWDQVWSTRTAEDVGWYQEEPSVSAGQHEEFVYGLFRRIS